MSKNRQRNESKQAVIDICILEAGRFDMLSKCLDAIYREAQLVPLNICIFDNASDAKERLENQHLFQYQPEKDPSRNVVSFQVKRSQTNLGFPMGSNEAARMGKASLIMFLGDDVELQEGAIENVTKRFRDETIGVVGIKLLFPPTSTHSSRPGGKVQHIGMAVNIRGEPIHPLVGWSPNHPKTQISRDVWAVTGACFSIRRNVFNKLGGFDKVYGLGTHEDLDLCMKVRQAGLRVYFDSTAVGYHYVGATAEKLQVSFPIMQNRQIFMSKWQGSGQVFWNEFEYW